MVRFGLYCFDFVLDFCEFGREFADVGLLFGFGGDVVDVSYVVVEVDDAALPLELLVGGLLGFLEYFDLVLECGDVVADVEDVLVDLLPK